MTRTILPRALIVSGLITIGGFYAAFAQTDPQTGPQPGIAMYGEPALPQDFVALPYANPDAPQGGRIVFGESGGFNALNPYILKGRAPWGMRTHVFETLMGRNWDEPFALYGLLAKTIETDPDRTWVEFTLRPEAAFSDGSPVTVEDVIWSFETLGTKGVPRYANAWKKIASTTKTGPSSVRFTFNTPDRELPLILGLRPILKKADWDGRDFKESSLDVPTGSGPYKVGKFETNRFISFVKNPDYWGKDLPFNRGRNNLAEIRYDYYGDGGVVFEAFKAGESSTYREWNAAKWKNAYDFPAVLSGDVVKSEIPHQRPSGMRGFAFNTRRDMFKDWRVREALIQAFNFEFINRTLNGGEQPRIASYFSNSVLGMDYGPASGRVAEYLAPFRDQLLPGALEGYKLPVSDGSERNRANLRRAQALLAEAGWTVQDGVLRNANGQAFTFDVLLKSGSTENEAIINIYIDALKRLGIVARIDQVDSAQHKERTTNYNFDMVYYRRGMSLSPGNEQKLYWGSAGVEKPGTRNYMGMNSPAAESMIDTMLNAQSQTDFVAATKALDRILTSGRYVIPIWHSTVSRLAHKKELKYPKRLPIYGDWIGFLPDVWWIEE
jgi:peptide/nickel transport system substrate-binding protein